jgi:hypothetical protein
MLTHGYAWGGHPRRLGACRPQQLILERIQSLLILHQSLVSVHQILHQSLHPSLIHHLPDWHTYRKPHELKKLWNY